MMNLYGVALASDTLASRKAEDGWISSEGNNKIWTVTGHPVQALHYGNTILGGIPHKIHFEAWVRTLTKPLPNIQAYVTSYKNYCVSAKSIHSRKAEAYENEVGVGADVPGGEREVLHGTFENRLCLCWDRIIEDVGD